MNKVLLTGNLGRDPELKYTKSGTPVADLRLATNRFYKNSDGKRIQETEWHRIVAWGTRAENCATYLKKGSRIDVEGRLKTRQWEDKDGVKRWTTEIIMENVEFSGRSPKQEQPPLPDLLDNDVSF